MKYTFALAGNPNCGKTTMFNALTGANQYVGNWPGVTVEKKEGKYTKNKEITITDLPGIYSMSPYTLEEVVSRDYVLNEDIDVIIDLVDATNIERNLYLTTQLIETGVPVVIALNMMDLVSKRGIKIDVERLSMLLNCPIVETSALKQKGLEALMHKAIEVANKNEYNKVEAIYKQDIEKAIEEVSTLIPSIEEHKRRWYAVKLLEDDQKIIEKLSLDQDAVSTIRNSLEEKYDDDMESIITDGRYTYIQKIISTTVKKSGEKLTTSDKIDKIVTNRILGIPIFMAVMFIVYYVSVTTIGTIVTDWTNDVFVVAIQEFFAGILENIGASEVITGLVVDGILGGLGAILGFAPQMAILFLFLSILEDCGYMVRIAFVMDRVFRHFGLSGKSFIPLLISSGCGIPGIMASKTIEQDNDRRLTIMTATFVPCGAKLPVIALLGGVVASQVTTGNYEAAAWLAPCMYFVGIAAVLCSAIILKKTKPFSGKPAPFVMELPQYHIPSAKTVLIHVWERLKGFLIKAGTILFVACVVIWFISTYGFDNGSFGIVDTDKSIMAIMGGALAPIFAPLGFGNWQAVAASISGFSAKEAIVSTMGVLANVAGDVEDAVVVAEGVATWFPTTASAISFLLFNLLDSPCLAAIATMAQQLNNRKWFWFAIIFQNVFAYCVSLVVYQFSLFYATGAFGLGTVVAAILFVVFIYLLFRKDPYKHLKTYSKRSVD